MILSHIVAAAENNTIGTQGDLPWELPEDMKFFRDKTKGHSMIMGRKTFESIGRPLPHRLNVIVTRQKDYKVDGAIVVESIEAAIELCKTRVDEFGDEIFIIGGGEIYKQSLPLVNRIYLTRIHREFSGETKYPDLSKSDFKLVNSLERKEPIPFTFETYERT